MNYFLSQTLAKFARRRTRGDTLVNILAGVIIILMLVVIVALAAGLGALLVLFAWNVGIVALVKACGGHVESLDFLAALGISIALNMILRLRKS